MRHQEPSVPYCPGCADKTFTSTPSEVLCGVCKQAFVVSALREENARLRTETMANSGLVAIVSELEIELASLKSEVIHLRSGKVILDLSNETKGNVLLAILTPNEIAEAWTALKKKIEDAPLLYGSFENGRVTQVFGSIPAQGDTHTCRAVDITLIKKPVKQG